MIVSTARVPSLSLEAVFSFALGPKMGSDAAVTGEPPPCRHSQVPGAASTYAVKDWPPFKRALSPAVSRPKMPKPTTAIATPGP